MQQEAQQQATEGSDAWSTVLFVWNSLRKNKILFFSAAIVTLAGAIFFTISQTKIYRSSGTIQIEPNPPRPMGNEIQSVVEMGTGSYLNNREYYETQYKILESRRISQLVVKTLGLQRDATFLANKPANTQLPSREVSVDAAAEILRSRIDIEPEKQSRLVVISVRDADPQRAQKIVTTVIQTYQEQNLDNVLQSTNSAVDWLREQQDSLKNELEKSELALHTYKKDKNILSLSFDDQSNMLRGEMQKLNELLTEVRAKKEGLAARRAELNTISADDPSKLASADLLSSPLLQRFREAYVDALQTRNSLRAAGKGPSHPELMAAEMQVSLTKKSLLNEVKNIKGAVDRDYRASAKEAAGLQKLYDAANKRALELNLMEIEFNRLKRKKDNTEKLYSMVRDRTKESDLTLMMRVNNIHVVDDATLPSRPVRPSMPVNVGAGLLLGLLLGVGMAVGRELMDRSVKAPEDIDAKLPFLGLLPAFEGSPQPGTKSRRRRRGTVAVEHPELIVHEHPTSGTAEAARAIRTNIMFMSPDNPYRVILVTSAAPREGKTTVSCCLATAMAQAGQRVLLMDCDLRRPRVHKVFGRTNGVGLTNALLDISALDKGITDTPVPGLSLLVSGPIPPNPAELLHSEAFGRVLDALRDRFDRVIIDSPPLGPVTDGVVLATRVDGTVFVVRAFETSKDVVRRALRSINNVKGTIIGTLLNGVSSTRPGYGGYGQSYYQYSDGYAPEAENEAA